MRQDLPSKMRYSLNPWGCIFQMPSKFSCSLLGLLEDVLPFLAWGCSIKASLLARDFCLSLFCLLYSVHTKMIPVSQAKTKNISRGRLQPSLWAKSFNPFTMLMTRMTSHLGQQWSTGILMLDMRTLASIAWFGSRVFAAFLLTKQRDWKIGKGAARWRCPDLTGFSHRGIHESKWLPRMQEATPWTLSCFP